MQIISVVVAVGRQRSNLLSPFAAARSNPHAIQFRATTDAYPSTEPAWLHQIKEDTKHPKRQVTMQLQKGKCHFYTPYEGKQQTKQWLDTTVKLKEFFTLKSK